jgi:adenylate cyclase class IV
MSEEKPKEYLEVEVKYNADEISRTAFKDLARSLNPKTFLYVESKDVYYVRQEDEFLRYRMPSENRLCGDDETRSELTFKKKHKENNNWVRTEVNLRIDKNDPALVHAFCEGLGYKKNFSIGKNCDIYFFDDADIVFYSVQDEDGKYANYLEIEASEDIGMTYEQSWEVVMKYEKLLLPLGISPQKRKKLSLYEMYKKEV